MDLITKPGITSGEELYKNYVDEKVSKLAIVNKINEIPHYGYIIKNSGDFVLRSSIKMAFDLFSEKQTKNENSDNHLVLLEASKGVDVEIKYRDQ